MIARGLFTHLTLLGVAIGASIFVWTRDKTPVASSANVTVWNARAADVQKVVLEAKDKKVSLEARKDAQGRWFLGTQSGTSSTPTQTLTFAAVGQADKLAEALAPLKALREVGVVGDDRAAEFGLKEPDGSLAATIAGKERKLTLGARTPGGADRYVKDDASNVVYVVKGEVTRDLEAGESALGERELHGFKDADIESLKISARGKARTVLHAGGSGGPEAKRIWADPADPEKADETVTNWIAKLDRLRPTEYLASEPRGAEPVARVDYVARAVSGAFVEIVKLPTAAPAGGAADASAPGPKAEYFLRSERTRLWAKVHASVAEQVEQDLPSIVR